VTSMLRPLGELICSESFFVEVVNIEVDHYSDPTTIMYCLDPMVLIYFRAPTVIFLTSRFTRSVTSSQLLTWNECCSLIVILYRQLNLSTMMLFLGLNPTALLFPKNLPTIRWITFTSKLRLRLKFLHEHFLLSILLEVVNARMTMGMSLPWSMVHDS